MISSDAAGEATRLGAQGIPLAPVPATSEPLERLTTIDEAVRLGPDGMCHAIGIILDGRARGHGDPARGSRLNSAVRYAESARASAYASSFYRAIRAGSTLGMQCAGSRLCAR